MLSLCCKIPTNVRNRRHAKTHVIGVWDKITHPRNKRDDKLRPYRCVQWRFPTNFTIHIEYFCYSSLYQSVVTEVAEPYPNQMKTNAKLLITGGTGSFGKTVLKEFLPKNIFDEIRVFSRDEKKQDDLRKEINDDRVSFFIGDVRDVEAVKDAMSGIDYVFHAAALKQVPSCEFFPIEAVKTNVLGTENIINAAIQCGVRKGGGIEHG